MPWLNERGFTLAKRKTRGKIDAAYALECASPVLVSDEWSEQSLIVL